MENLQKLTQLIRYYILTMTTHAGSGHTTSSLSAVELMTALMFGGFFRTDLENPQNPTNDRLIFSKGHASPLFYSLYTAAGKLTEKDLKGYRKFTSPLEGHPTLEFPYTEAPTGSLGQGLPIGLGMAMALRLMTGPVARVSQSRSSIASRNGDFTNHNRYSRLQGEARYGIPRSRHPSFPTVYVLLGDGEMAEGSVWEAIQAASFHKVDNLVAILDVNRLGQSQPTMLEHDLNTYKKRFEAFGWEVIVVKNGHNLKEIVAAYREINGHSGKRSASRMTDKPVVIIAKTFKGYGVKLLQNKDNWHGKPLPKDLYEQAVKELGKVDFGVKGKVAKTNFFGHSDPEYSGEESSPNGRLKNVVYHIGDTIATRQAAGDALTQLMYKYPQVVVLDGDVKNSLFTESTQKAHPDRYFEMFIAEQNMVGTAIGFSRRGYIPFVTTFSAFMTRAFDQIRMAALARANIKFIGSHAGVSIGEDGASQMGLEDLSMFRNVFGSCVLCPADAASAQKLVEEMIKNPGINYIRVARPGTKVIYDEKEKFPIETSKIHKLLKSPKSLKKKVMIVAAGITVYEALNAQENLSQKGIEAIVVDCYSIKPIDADTLINLSNEFSTILTVEDHWFEGGLGDAVLNVFSRKDGVKIYKLAVTKMPHSGKPAELLDYEEISATAIVSQIKSLL